MKPLKCLALAAGYAHILHFSISYSVINRWCAYVYKYWPLFDCKFPHDTFKQLHSFPEGKVAQDHQPIRRLKWGTASLIIRAPVTPIVLPIIHTGFEKV
jgi:monolysocardiolipin acyltransferase